MLFELWLGLLHSVNDGAFDEGYWYYCNMLEVNEEAKAASGVVGGWGNQTVYCSWREIKTASGLTRVCCLMEMDMEMV